MAAANTPLDPPCPVLPAQQRRPLYDVATTRRLEAAALSASAPHALMACAGLMVARLAQALAAPEAAIWVAAGPGNNGGDGLVAARYLRQWGRAVQVHWLGDAARLPDDARDALATAQAAGVPISPGLPPVAPAGFHIDALLGIGARQAPDGAVAAAIGLFNAGRGDGVLALDLPSGLAADTGQPLGAAAVRADHTLALLTLKPGLFTGAGREHAGRIWWHGLGVARDDAAAPTAWLGGPARDPVRDQDAHKGTFGDVIVLGGAPGMGGAALLAASAALAAGAGRVLVARLDDNPLAVDPLRPELMPRRPADLLLPAALATATVVAGCGGGQAIAEWLPAVLAHAGRLVLDADGLNAVAADAALAALLSSRAKRGQATVITPHPLEAARLLATPTANVQADRLASAAQLAQRFAATVVLKGSGSVIASPDQLPTINPTGGPRLATAGSGDVLAGWLAGRWSASGAQVLTHDAVHAVAVAAVWQHGAAGESGDARRPLRAGDLVEALMNRGPPPAVPG
jgi:hydroxyethylthiazole kinase-like uncharacterized protein yjeF